MSISAKKLRRIKGIFLASTLALGLAPSLGVGAGNIIRDPSMQSGTQYWKPKDYASSVVKSPSRSGTGAIKMINDGTGNPNTSKTHQTIQSNAPGVSAGKEYVYSIWVRGDKLAGVGSGGKPLSVIRWKNSSGGNAREELYMWAPYGSYTWKQLTIHAEAPPGASRLDNMIRSWWDCTGGISYWDDASLVLRQFPNRGASQGTYQAENGTISGGRIERREPDYSGSGYFKPNSGGYVEWRNVDGGGGGKRIISARYAHEGNVKDWELFVNGASQGKVKPVATGRLTSWATHDWEVNLKPGNNTIRLKALRYTAGPLIDRINVYAKAGSGGGGSVSPPPATGSTASAPTFSPNGGTHTDSVTVALKTATGGATVYYTTDGTTPNTNSQYYGGPILLTKTTRIKAIATADGYKNSAVASKSFTIATGSSGGSQSPYGGVAWAIPGKIQVEDYDVGGQRVAYSDSSTGNNGGAYRGDDVDMWRNSSDAGGGYMVGATSSGEWLEYTVRVGTAGSYTLGVRAVAKQSGKVVHVEVDGANVTGPLAISGSGNWTDWQTYNSKVNLSSGKHTVRVVVDKGSVNLNYIEFRNTSGGGGSTQPPPSSSGGQAPYGGQVRTIPTKIQAEDYDEGGRGVAYSDSSPGNKGGVYRSDDVDIWSSSKDPYVGATTSGEWLEYTIKAPSSGKRTLRMRAVARDSGKVVHVELNGKDVTGPIKLPSNGSWQNWQVVSKSINVPGGKQVMRLVFNKGPVNVDWISIN